MFGKCILFHIMFFQRSTWVPLERFPCMWLYFSRYCRVMIQKPLYTESASMSWMWPLPVTVTTRTWLVGNPYKPSFTTATGRGPHPMYVLDSIMGLFLSAFSMLGGTCTGTREYAGSPSRSPGHIKWMFLKESRGTFRGDLGYANDMHAGKLPYMAWWLHLRLS